MQDIGDLQDEAFNKLKTMSLENGFPSLNGTRKRPN